MSSPPAIRWLAADGFRGFTRRVEFDLAASAVIVTGSNGTGKTCFFDAIQWLLVGQVARLKKLRGHQDDEYIVSAYRRGEPAIVEADLEVGGSSLRLRRSGHSRSSLLEVSIGREKVLRGESAEHELRQRLTHGAQVSIETLLNTSGLLQQDVMRAVLEGKRAERYEDISHMLGLDELNDFERKATEEADATEVQLGQANAVIADAATRGAQLVAEISSRESEVVDAAPIEVARAAVVAVLAGLVDADRLPVIERASQAAEQSTQWRAIASALSEWARRLGTADNESLVRAERVRAAAAQEVVAATSRAAEAAVTARLARDREAALDRDAADLARLAALAAPLLGDKCPVCGQKIDAAAVRRQLTRGPETSDLVAAKRARIDAEASRDFEARRVAALEENLAQFVAEHGRLAEARDAAAAAHAQLVGLLQSASIKLRLAETPSATDVSQLAILASQLSGALGALTTSMATTERRATVPAVQADLQRLRSVEAAQTARRDELQKRLLQQQTLVQATRQAKLRVVGERFERLGPLISDIYQRLDPHPTFTDMEFVWESYRSKGTSAASVLDPQSGISADPLLVFSTSQANISALAYFLALCLATGHDGLPFVLLDDPLQSMDDVNVLGFADLCRFVRDSKQVILSTHERRLAGLLERKLAPRTTNERTVVIEFESWSRSGPHVSAREVREQLSDGANLVVAASP